MKEDLSRIISQSDTAEEAFGKFKKTDAYRSFEQRLSEMVNSDESLKRRFDTWEGSMIGFDENGEPTFLGITTDELSVVLRDVFRYGKHFPKGSWVVGSKNPFKQKNDLGELAELFGNPSLL